MKVAAPALIVCGLLLFVLSNLWTVLFSSASNWTEEKAKRSAEIKARLSNLGPLVNSPTPTVHRGPDPASYKAEYESLKKENEQLNSEFTSAAERPHTISKVLKWSGISLAAFGIVGWYATNQSR
jgi:hypothetical protein